MDWKEDKKRKREKSQEKHSARGKNSLEGKGWMLPKSATNSPCCTLNTRAGIPAPCPSRPRLLPHGARPQEPALHPPPYLATGPASPGTRRLALALPRLGGGLQNAPESRMGHSRLPHTQPHPRRRRGAPGTCRRGQKLERAAPT